MEVPSLADILRVHDRVLTLGGGDLGVLNLSAIESALHRASWGPFFSNPDLADRAALLVRGLCQDHPFADGNKRTALVATDLFLRLNEHHLRASQDDLVAFMLDVAQAHLSLDGIADWIRLHLHKH